MGDHYPYLFEGTERFCKPNYIANLTTNWNPSDLAFYYKKY
jgi:hypothetical protein